MPASAAEPEERAPKPAPHTIDFETGTGFAFFGDKGQYNPYQPTPYFFQLALGYHISPAFSVGGVSSFAMLPGLMTWRVGPEARFHFVHTRAADLWLGAEAGAFVTSYHSIVHLDCFNGPCAQTETPTHVTPLVGVGLGASLLPSPYFSVGIESRAILGSDAYGETPYPVFAVMLTLGGRAPIGATTKTETASTSQTASRR